MKVWIEKPVTEKPEKSMAYPMITNKGISIELWMGDHWALGLPTGSTHYLVPIEVDHVLTEWELNEMKSASWKNGYDEGQQEAFRYNNRKYEE